MVSSRENFTCVKQVFQYLTPHKLSLKSDWTTWCLKVPPFKCKARDLKQFQILCKGFHINLLLIFFLLYCSFNSCVVAKTLCTNNILLILYCTSTKFPKCSLCFINNNIINLQKIAKWLKGNTGIRNWTVRRLHRRLQYVYSLRRAIWSQDEYAKSWKERLQSC